MHQLKLKCMKHLKLWTILMLVTGLNGCQNNMERSREAAITSYDAGTFGYDLNFLQGKDSVLVLKNKSGKGQLIVSAKYQGKVFTSTAEGLAGKSFGWINYPAFDGELNQHMNAYGGENRLWLGPEGG